MKKRLMVSLMLMAGVIFAYSMQASANGFNGYDCTPGYWKNHTEVWDGVGCGLPAEQDGDLLVLLTTKGGSEESEGKSDKGKEGRYYAADILNHCLDLAGLVNCEDDE